MSPRPSATLAEHMTRAEESLRDARDALRSAASIARVEKIAEVDPEALEAFAAVTDANRGGVERMGQRVEHAGGGRARMRAQTEPEASAP